MALNAGRVENFTKVFIPIFVPLEEESPSIGYRLNLSELNKNIVSQKKIAERITNALSTNWIQVGITQEEVLEIIKQSSAYKDNYSHIIALEVFVKTKDLIEPTSVDELTGKNFGYKTPYLTLHKHSKIIPMQLIGLDLIYGDRKTLGYRHVCLKSNYAEEDQNYHDHRSVHQKFITFLNNQEFWKSKNNKIKKITFPYVVIEMQKLARLANFDIDELKELAESQLPIDSRPGLFKRFYRFHMNYSTTAKDVFKIIRDEANLHDIVACIEKKYGPINIGAPEINSNRMAAMRM